MADKQATLWIRLRDDVSHGIAGIKNAIGGLHAGFLAITASVVAFTAFLVEATNAFAEHETAINRLNTALKNQGTFTAAYSQQLQDMAAQIQKVTAFSDESILETMTLLTTFGLAGEKLRETTKAALDLSVGLGIDLRTATLILGKAWAGETTTLTRYGIKIDETLSSGEKFAAVLDAVRGRFGGSAAAELETYAGKLKDLADAWSEIKETLGEFLVGPATTLLRWASNWVSSLQQVVDWTKRAFSTKEHAAEITHLEKRAADLTARINGLNVVNQTATNTYRDLRNQLQAVNQEIQRLSGAPMPVPPPPPLSKPFIDEAALAKEQEISETRASKLLEEYFNFTTTEEQKTAAHAEGLAKRLEADGAFDLANNVREKASAEAERKRQEHKKAQFMATLNFISSLQSAKSKELAAIGKAAAISETTINTYRAAQGAYAALSGIPIVGPGLGIAAAALAITAGLARVAAIAGTPLAAGGVVLPSSGGSLVRIAEAGRAEAVIPLDDTRATDKLRETFDFGPGGNTIQIYAGTIIATDYEVKEFARRIDRELYELGRARQSANF